MAQIGNKQNSYLNGAWGKHAPKDGRSRKIEKRNAAKRRRRISRSIISEQLDKNRIRGRGR